MVFQRKSAGKAKQQTPAKSKKSVDNDLEDMDMDFGDSNVMKKTPGKTPKGKQAQNDKRVSFQIPGKNTPSNKGTPKGGVLVGKKQVTPGKPGNLKAFGGMAANSSAKKNGKAKKATSDDDDDDEDDDDDDDDDEDDDDEGDDLDMMFAGDSEDDDDDDDEDDDDSEEDEEDEEASKNKKTVLTPKKKAAEDDEEDDEDDDDDEEDDDEEDEELPQNKQKAKQNQSKIAQKKDSTPAQNKNAKPTEKSPVKKEAASPKKTEVNPIVKNFIELDTQRRRERDARTLYIGNLPKDIAATELKALSSDILVVNIPNHQKNKRSVFAFLEFNSESKAEENFKLLKSKKLRGEAIAIDYAGEKSLNRKMTEQPAKDFNLKKLYVADIPADGMMDQVAKLFPKSTQITLAVRPTFKSATILFSNENDAAEAIEAAKGAKIGSKAVTVVYSVQRDSGSKKKRKRANKGKQQNQAGAKRMKLEVESDDDDDDDDDDDEEEE